MEKTIKQQYQRMCELSKEHPYEVLQVSPELARFLIDREEKGRPSIKIEVSVMDAEATMELVDIMCEHVDEFPEHVSDKVKAWIKKYDQEGEE